MIDRLQSPSVCREVSMAVSTVTYAIVCISGTLHLPPDSKSRVSSASGQPFTASLVIMTHLIILCEAFGKSAIYASGCYLGTRLRRRPRDSLSDIRCLQAP